jgi:hypothetical protein
VPRAAGTKISTEVAGTTGTFVAGGVLVGGGPPGDGDTGVKIFFGFRNPQPEKTLGGTGEEEKGKERRTERRTGKDER